MVEIATHAAGAGHAEQKAVTPDGGVQVLELLLEDAALVHAELERGPRAEVGDVPDVVVKTLQLEQDAAHDPRAQAWRQAAERLDSLRVRDSVRERARS